MTPLPSLSIRLAVLLLAYGVCTAATPPLPVTPPSPEATRASLWPTRAGIPFVMPCEPSGRRGGKDYQVGDGPGQLPSLDRVPWEDLGPGDTVRIFHRAAPYKGKFAINAHGSADAPVRVCGVKGPGGERPVIDGADAPTRKTLSYGRGSASLTNQQRGIVMVVAKGDEDGKTQPSYVQIDGLKIQRGHPDYAFQAVDGTSQRYAEFGGCIWLERGHHLTIADNEITDCMQAIFSRSQDGGPATETRDVLISGNWLHDNGIAGKDTMHTTYVQSVGAIYEFNHYGSLRKGARGNSIKDRSVGMVVRYNRIDDGARAIDMVEAEDYPEPALADPAYRSSWVYGNQILKDGRKGATFHYGGDHAGSEGNYRKGTLYFFHNTVRLTGDDYAALFQLSTTEEKAEVWNNVFLFDPAIAHPRMRAGQDNDDGIATGGVITFGRNWIDARWIDAGRQLTLGGKLVGVENLIAGTTWPVDADTFVPLAGGKASRNGLAGPAAAQSHPVRYQVDSAGRPSLRLGFGAGADLGAIEGPANPAR